MAAQEGGIALCSRSSIVTDPVSATKMVRYANILKSEQDTREYRGLVLDNGMRVVVISDPQTDKSAAALSVEVEFRFRNSLINYFEQFYNKTFL